MTIPTKEQQKFSHFVSFSIANIAVDMHSRLTVHE